MQVYQSHLVKKLSLLYKDINADMENYTSMYRHLFDIAERMWEGVMAENQAVFSEISNYHPSFLGKSFDYLVEVGITREDCRLTTAVEYGFEDWEMVEELEEPYDMEFENAVNFLLNGDFENLKKQLENNPELINAVSQYGHEATLLHYAGSNGVEMWRQKVPANLLEMVKWLLSKGAKKDAIMFVFDGEFTPYQLFSTSAHPQSAGVSKELFEILNP